MFVAVAFTAGILSILQLLMVMLVYLPIRVFSSGLAPTKKVPSGWLNALRGQTTLLIQFIAVFAASE